jgi:hypothetical protein
MVDSEEVLVMVIADEVMLRLEPQFEQWSKDLWHLYVMKGNVSGEHSFLCDSVLVFVYKAHFFPYLLPQPRRAILGGNQWAGLLF